MKCNANDCAAMFMKYSHHPLPLTDLIDGWSSQGLRIDNKTLALHQVKTIGYHRLNRYARFFRDPQGAFKRGLAYEDLWAVYVFDRRLRLLSLDAIESIEIAVRTTMSDVLCLHHGPHWFMDASLFKEKSYASEFQNHIEKAIRKDCPKYQSYEVMQYYNKYTSPHLPPSWVVMEHLSMGEWCKALPMLNRIEQKAIASEFGLPSNLMTSWISSLALLRNVCAHHGMVWNRRNTRRPALQKKRSSFCPDFSKNSDSYYASACIMQYFLKHIASPSSWSSQLKELFDEYPLLFINDLCFPQHWSKDTFWYIR